MSRPTRRKTTAHLNGCEWWLSKTGKDGSQCYPERIRVGGRDNPRMYYPVDRDALLALADEMDDVAGCVRIKGSVAVGWVDQWSKSIREALRVSDG